jgi:hypothetical protein
MHPRSLALSRFLGPAPYVVRAVEPLIRWMSSVWCLRARGLRKLGNAEIPNFRTLAPRGLVVRALREKGKGSQLYSAVAARSPLTQVWPNALV